MPDGDVVHPNLARRYYKPYKELCEGLNNYSVANSILITLKKDLKDYGDEPISLIKMFTNFLKTTTKVGSKIDTRRAYQYLEVLGKKCLAGRRAKELALKACRQLLFELQNGKTPSDLEKAACYKFTGNIYQANFAERVPLSPDHNHYNETTYSFIRGKLAQIDPLVKEGIEYLASQLTREKPLARIRLPRYADAFTKVDLDTDIFKLGA